ncbi:unnamed protein product [Porites evermanni]|uniref:Uncharacterized protein n=1 Tax=Porites evermanni TaxID=104178 RepID=A0ABN8PKM1_9CNID|nr:unnamed protein product [Porites evermanni]
MGSGQSKGHSKQKTITSSGFLGRERQVQGRYYFYLSRVRILEINGRAIGREITRRCGNEGQHRYLNNVDWTTLRFLRAANSLLPDARDDGANMRNCAFILRQPGREFVIISGNGDWEYDFSEDADGEIYGRCVRKPFLRYAWDGAKSAVVRIFSFVASTAVGFLTGGLYGAQVTSFYLLFSCGVYTTVAPTEGAQPVSNSVYKRSVSITPSLSLMFHSHAVFFVILFILNKLLLCS